MSGENVVAAARRWIGTPYRHQGSRLGAGCDCLGLLRGVWRMLYGAEPETVPAYGMDWRGEGGAALEAAAERHLVPADGEMAEGDVLLFRLIANRPPRHCGIFAGNGRFIHAQERLGVVEIHLGEGWSRRVAGRYRFPLDR